MKEHPIPQDITGYRFHIVGNMTLKQFVEVAIGVVISVIFYSLHLPPIITWPLVVFFLGVGALAAFVPIEERPLDHWIVTFFKVLYKPTQFYWRRVPTIPDVFNYQPRRKASTIDQEIDLSPAHRQRIKEYMKSLNAQPSSGVDLPDDPERIKSILNYFYSNPSQTSGQRQKTTVKPNLSVRVRGLKPPSKSKVLTSATFVTPKIIEDRTPTKRPTQSVAVAADKVVTPSQSIITIVEDQSQKSDPTKLKAHGKKLSAQTFVQSQTPTKQEIKTTETAFNANLPFPSAPTEPNKLVGMVLTNNQELVPGAIIEVLKADGHIVRAVKTNALGQFFVTTPLADGQYIIEAQKDGLSFQPQSLQVKNSILDPVEIKAIAGSY